MAAPRYQLRELLWRHGTRFLDGMKERKEAVARALEKCLQGKYGEARELLAEVPGAEAELLLAKIDFAEGYWEKALEAANGSCSTGGTTGSG